MSARIRLFRRRLRNRDGFAMFMALGALVIIAVLVAASSMISLQETRLGQNSLVQARAFAAAEYGLNRIQADWDRTPNLTMEVGARFDTTYTLAQGTAEVHYVRLNNETFWIVSEGLAMVGDNISLARQGRKRLGAILRLRIPTIKSEGAITANGSIKVSGSVTIDGTNTVPPGWDDNCDASQPSKAGVAVPLTASVTDIKEANIVGGDPKILQSSTAGQASTYVSYGDENWNSMAALANFRYTDGTLPDARPIADGTGACNRADTRNWGEPYRATDLPPGSHTLVPACENWFPIIYATCPAPWPTSGNCVISFNGGRGQGIMLIHGDLYLNGNLDWFGLIVVSGDVKKGNGNPNMYGSVMSANSDMDLSGSEFTGNADFMYSQCSLERAMRGTAQVLQAKERSWTELY
jgi:hypothetical protein